MKNPRFCRGFSYAEKTIFSDTLRTVSLSLLTFGRFFRIIKSSYAVLGTLITAHFLNETKKGETAMEPQALRDLLQQISDGHCSVDDAMLKLKLAPFEDLEFAKLDHHRSLRQGIGEVIYGAGNTGANS